MPAWSHFLQRISGQTQITLIGPLPHSPQTLQGPTVFVDGGHAQRGRMPGSSEFVFSVGDGDSLRGGGLDKTLPIDKDHSDLAFVLGSLPSSVNRLSLYGFMGGRLDHELANLGEVFSFLKRLSAGRCDFYTSSAELGMVAWSGLTLSLPIHGLFSVFTFEAGPIQIRGSCRYPLDPPRDLMPLSSHGLSNEGHGQVHLASTAPALLCLNLNR